MIRVFFPGRAAFSFVRCAPPLPPPSFRDAASPSWGEFFFRGQPYRARSARFPRRVPRLVGDSPPPELVANPSLFRLFSPVASSLLGIVFHPLPPDMNLPSFPYLMIPGLSKFYPLFGLRYDLPEIRKPPSIVRTEVLPPYFCRVIVSPL